MANSKCTKENIIDIVNSPILNPEQSKIQEKNSKYDLEILHKPAALLKKLAKLLRFLKVKNQKIVTTKELEKFLHHTEAEGTYLQQYFRFDSDLVLQKIRMHFSNEIDFDIIAVKLFTNCLNYIANATVDNSQSISIARIVETISKFQYAISNFSHTDKIIIEMKLFKNSVCYYLQDLFKILSNCECSTVDDYRLQNFQRCSDIRSIIISLGKLPAYQNVIIELIIAKIRCALSYFQVNPQFDGFTYKEILILDFYLSITKIIMFRSVQYLDHHLPLNLRQTLEELKFHIQDKIPCILNDVLENIIKIL